MAERPSNWPKMAERPPNWRCKGCNRGLTGFARATKGRCDPCVRKEVAAMLDETANLRLIPNSYVRRLLEMVDEGDKRLDDEIRAANRAMAEAYAEGEQRGAAGSTEW